MRRLSEMFDDTWVLSQVEEDLQVEEHLESLDPSAEKRILALALQKINEEPTESTDDDKKKKIRVFGRGRLLLVALVAVFIGTITVSAHEGGMEAILAPVVEMIESISVRAGLKERVNISSDEEAEKLVVENIRENIESEVDEEKKEDEQISDEHSGVKVSVDQVISDGEDAYVYLAVDIEDSIIPEQWPAEDRLYFRQNYIRVDNGEPQKHNFELFQEADGTIYGIIHIPMENLASGNVAVSLSLNNLDFIIGGGEDREIIRLVEGEWNLSWDLKCEKIAKTYDINAIIEMRDGTVILNEAAVSPLSVSVKGMTEKNEPGNPNAQYGCFIYGMILKDGTIVACDGSFAQEQEGSERILLKYYFDKMMDMDDVVGVVVNDDHIYFKQDLNQEIH